MFLEATLTIMYYLYYKDNILGDWRPAKATYGGQSLLAQKLCRAGSNHSDVTNDNLQPCFSSKIKHQKNHFRR